MILPLCHCQSGVHIIPFSIPFGIHKFERNGGKFFLNDNDVHTVGGKKLFWDRENQLFWELYGPLLSMPFFGAKWNKEELQGQKCMK